MWPLQAYRKLAIKNHPDKNRCGWFWHADHVGMQHAGCMQRMVLLHEAEHLGLRRDNIDEATKKFKVGPL